MLNLAYIGLLVGLAIISALGILAARLSHSKRDTKPSPIGFSQSAANHNLVNLNKDDPEGMKLAGGGNAKSQFPVPNSGR
jgi:hypothetical protein